MRDCRVEEVSHITDSDEDSDTPPQTADLTIGVFPSHQSPTYFIMANKGDKVRSGISRDAVFGTSMSC